MAEQQVATPSGLGGQLTVTLRSVEAGAENMTVRWALRWDADDITLKVQGHGESDPVAENEVDGGDNPAGHALNRRVEVTFPSA